ncbi:MAG: hypothetical protein Q7U20_09875 [Caulobacter sp.]|nr:hypothetical protein [Caulobacter sp.]
MDPSYPPWTYSGLLDDSVQRYPVAGDVGEAFFSRMIAKNLFFSGGLLLNDGYLVNHPSSRRELLREDSILRRMLSFNIVRVLSREDTPEGFADMPRRMAEQGNRSFQTLTGSNEWEPLRRELKIMGRNLFHYGNVMAWPRREMHLGFTALMDRVFRSSPDALGVSLGDISMAEIETAFNARDPRSTGPRDKFERSVLQVTRRRGETSGRVASQLMNLANQAYHYNFGLCLTPQLGTVAVDTTTGPAFGDFHALEDGDEDLIRRIPVIPIPKCLPFEKGSAFVDLIDPNTRLGRAKLGYLQTLEPIFSGQVVNSDEALKDAREAGELYCDRIAEHFSKHVSTWIADVYFNAALTLGIGAVADGVTSVVEAALPMTGMVVSIAEDRLSPKEFLLRAIRRRRLRHDLDSTFPPLEPDKFYMFKASELRPVYASMTLDKARAETFVTGVPARG